MKIEAATPEDYIAQLPEDKGEVIKKLRAILLANLPLGFAETMNYNMITYVVPHELYPPGYKANPKLALPFISLASQKNYFALYHMGIYANKELLDWFTEAYEKACPTKLDMGKGCIRFKKAENIPFDLIATLVSKVTVEQWIKLYTETFLRK